MRKLKSFAFAVIAFATVFLAGSVFAAEHVHPAFLTAEYQNTGWECADVDSLAQWTFSGKLGGAWVNSGNLSDSTGYFVTKQGDGVTFEMQTIDSETKAVLVMLKIMDGSVWAKAVKAAFRAKGTPLGTQMFSDAVGTRTDGTSEGVLAGFNNGDGYGVAQMAAVSPASSVREATLNGDCTWVTAPWGVDGAPSDADTGAKFNVIGPSTLTISASAVCSSIEVTGTADLTIDAGNLLTCNTIAVSDYTGTLTLKAAKAFTVDFGAANFVYEYTGEEPASATISGTGAFTKAGAGTLTILNDAFGVGYAGTVTISAGTLSISTIRGFGAKPTVSIAAGATWEVTSGGTGGHEEADCSQVTGTGKVKFRSTGGTKTEYRLLPPADKMWASTLGFENAVMAVNDSEMGGVLFVSDADYVFGTLSGTGDFWSTSGTANKMIVKQGADSTWSGRLRSGSINQEDNNRIYPNGSFRRTFVLEGEDGATLTVSGNVGQNDIVVEPTGSLALTGSWTAPQVTVNGTIGGTGSIAATDITFGAGAKVNASMGALTLNATPTFGDALTVAVDEISAQEVGVLQYLVLSKRALPSLDLEVGGQKTDGYALLEIDKKLVVVDSNRIFKADVSGGELAWSNIKWGKSWVPGGVATLEVTADTTLVLSGDEEIGSLSVAGAGNLKIKVSAPASVSQLYIAEESELTVEVDADDEFSLLDVRGGKIVKVGEGTLFFKNANDSALNGTTVDIQEGRVEFKNPSGYVVATNPTFIIGENGTLDNYGWITINGTLTVTTDFDKAIFTNNGGNNASINAGPSFVKNGTGAVTIPCGIVDGTSIGSVAVNGGSLDITGARSMTGAITGSGLFTVYWLPTGTTQASLQNAGSWAGTLWIKNVSTMPTSGYAFNTYANARSTVRLTNVKGWLELNHDQGTVDLVDGPNGELALEVTDSSADYYGKFSKLTGSGTLKYATVADTAAALYVMDVSEFTGKLLSTAGRHQDGATPTAPRPIYIGSDTGAKTTESLISIADGATIGCTLQAESVVFGRTLRVKGALQDVVATGLAEKPENLEYKTKVTIVGEDGKETRGRLVYRDGTIRLGVAPGFVFLVK